MLLWLQRLQPAVEGLKREGAGEITYGEGACCPSLVTRHGSLELMQR